MGAELTGPTTCKPSFSAFLLYLWGQRASPQLNASLLPLDYSWSGALLCRLVMESQPLSGLPPHTQFLLQEKQDMFWQPTPTKPARVPGVDCHLWATPLLLSSRNSPHITES